MQAGVGIDERLGLSLDQQRQLVQQAARLGYDSLWTPAGATGRSAFHTCVQWWQASGLRVGISVVPFPAWTPATLAAEAATVSELTNGKHMLGIGLGGYPAKGFRDSMGLPEVPPVTYSREYVEVLRAFFAGEQVDHVGPGVIVRGLKLGVRAPKVPVYLAALNPRMLRLSGELADGVTPNWSSAEQIPWMREYVAEGARRSGRQPESVPFAQYIRVCIDQDEDAARRAFVSNMLGYALARPGQPRNQGYRAHFGRMGFEELLTGLEERRDAGTPVEQLVDAVPSELALKVGYFGKPAGAAKALQHLSQGLDEAMVRLISPRRGDLDGCVKAIDACQPSGWRKR
ncbi:MAG: LLM class flavin-dependent oxidoreductase [Chloroflexi bacterium]|nr:LLM class flavin-dependent oxidoreductase [Chloroflexota bacterium]